MKWKVFSPEEVVSLRNNPYTLKATEKTITFTLKFKEVMLDGLQRGKSPESIMRELGYDPAVIGDSRVKGIAYHITKEAESPEGLHEGRRTPARAVTEEEVASSAPSRSLRRLQAEVSYLRQEVCRNMSKTITLIPRRTCSPFLLSSVDGSQKEIVFKP